MTTLFHVSDVHFGAEDHAALAAFTERVDSERPNAVVITGDLTMSARSREFVGAQAWLERLGVPIALSVGNHDLPLINPVARLFWPYRRYLAIEASLTRRVDLPGLVVVPLKTTARFQWRLNWSKGSVSEAALAETLGLVSAAPAGKAIVVASHHPLVEVETAMAGNTRGGADALLALKRAGVEAVLSGHVHDPFDRIIETAAGQIRVIGAGTLSKRLRDSAPSFNELRFSPELEMTVRTL